MSEARPFASQTGKSPSEKKRVTLRDVAEEAGVSLKTASNVINHTGRMTDATREKVQKSWIGSATASTCPRATSTVAGPASSHSPCHA